MGQSQVISNSLKTLTTLAEDTPATPSSSATPRVVSMEQGGGDAMHDALYSSEDLELRRQQVHWRQILPTSAAATPASLAAARPLQSTPPLHRLSANPETETERAQQQPTSEQPVQLLSELPALRFGDAAHQFTSFRPTLVRRTSGLYPRTHTPHKDSELTTHTPHSRYSM